jgi:hypothetical protein
MSNIYTICQSQDIVRNIKSLIDEGYKSYYDLSIGDQESLLSIVIKQLGNDAMDALVDQPENLLHHLQNYMLTGKFEHTLDLAETMSHMLSKHYSLYIAEVYDEIVIENIATTQHEHDRILVIDKVNGERKYIQQGGF